MKVLKQTLLIVPLVLFLFGCNSNEPTSVDVDDMDIDNVVVPDGFNYSTTKDVEFELIVPENLKKAVFSVVAFKKGVDSLVVAKGTFDDIGIFNSTVTIPSYIDTLVVRSEYIGLIDEISVPVAGKRASFDYRPLYSGTSKSGDLKPINLKSASANGYAYMGSFNSDGVPSYLITSDLISQNLLEDINASLPEQKKVTDIHPEYLASSAETNIVLTKKADVWVTFVHEGADYRNSLGYYAYKVGQEPKTRAEIEALTVVFPNLSYSGSGGGLKSGDKVHLGQFEANTVISWFLVADGWSGKTVTDGRGIFYSQSNINPEKNSVNKNHMVLLWDKTRELLLMGFEDINREESGCDNDFNDAVYYATVNPVDAVLKSDVQPIDAANDEDGDGVNDELDDFPYDPNKSFNNFSPSKDNTGTLVYEDLWPSKGDYDFNDLVMGYNFNMIANGKNHITAIEATFTVKQIGGSFRNGFAFVLPVPADKIKSVTNQAMNAGYATLNANGTESGVNETVIFVTENATKLKGQTLKIVIDFKTGVNKNTLGSVPFNPFIIVDGDRKREVHLPDLAPTSKGLAMLGQGDDYSSVENNRYYKTDRNLPWALNFYTDFVTPEEKVSIDKVYPRFIKWANSGGTVELDWYKR